MNNLKRFAFRVIMQNRFKNTRKIRVDKHVQFFAVCPSVWDVLIIQKFVHAERVLHLPFHQPVGKVNKARSVRTAQKKFEFIKMRVNDANKGLHRFFRNRPDVFGISRVKAVKAFIRSRLIFILDTLDGRFHERRKKRLFVLKMTVKRTGRYARLLTQIPQVCALVAVPQKHLFAAF